MCAIFMKMASAVLTLQYNMARGSVTAPKGAKRRISLDFIVLPQNRPLYTRLLKNLNIFRKRYTESNNWYLWDEV